MITTDEEKEALAESLKAAIERKREREQAQRDQDALMCAALKRYSKASPIQLLTEGNIR